MLCVHAGTLQSKRVNFLMNKTYFSCHVLVELVSVSKSVIVFMEQLVNCANAWLCSRFPVASSFDSGTSPQPEEGDSDWSWRLCMKTHFTLFSPLSPIDSKSTASRSPDGSRCCAAAAHCFCLWFIHTTNDVWLSDGTRSSARCFARLSRLLPPQVGSLEVLGDGVELLPQPWTLRC